MPASQPRILCVDDEPLNLKVLGTLLAASGYQTLKAKDGAEALDMVRQGGGDLVLLDVMMPKLDGFAVCRAMKQSEQLRGIPVIMLTTLSATADRIKGIEAGAEDFISKPFDQWEVLARIRMLFKMKRLNDRLNSSYLNIARLTSFGEQMVAHFDPANFDFMEKIDDIVHQIIRSSSELSDSPRTVVIGMRDQARGCRWYRYDSLGETAARSSLPRDLDLDEHLSFGETDLQLAVYNESEAEAGCAALAGAMKKLLIPVNNLVHYSNESFCAIALNYGREVSGYDAAVLKSFVMQSLFLRSLSGQVRETESAFEYTVYALARASEANDEDTGNHILRVGDYSAVIAEGLGMPGHFVESMRLQATLHDVGKVHIHQDILRKPGKLTPEEWVEMKSHTLQGAVIVGDHPRLQLAKEIALSHHERWEGGGYPEGLQGERIPLAARILNIADQYDALRSRRSYKPAFDHPKAYDIIVRGDGRTMPGHFDPRILEVFKQSQARFEAISLARAD
jgi:response regulator RpfG family c-di-GMP phosphodiesterase